jgi:hypothetical protein
MDKTKREPHQSGGLFLWRVAGKWKTPCLQLSAVVFRGLLLRGGTEPCVTSLRTLGMPARSLSIHARYRYVQLRFGLFFLRKLGWPIQYRPKAQRSRSAQILRDLPVAVPGPPEAPTAGHDWTGRRRRNSQTNTRATTEISNPARAPVAVTVRRSWALGIRRPSHATPRHITVPPRSFLHSSPFPPQKKKTTSKGQQIAALKGGRSRKLNPIHQTPNLCLELAQRRAPPRAPHPVPA